MLHLRDEVRHEHELAVARARDERVLTIARVRDDESRVDDLLRPTEAFLVGLPALAIRRVREHEVELLARKRVIRQRRVFGAALHIICGFALALQNQVGLRDGVGLGVDLLTVEVG